MRNQKRTGLTLERLKELYTYDRDTGVFTWTGVKGGGRLKPTKKGADQKLRLYLLADGRQYPASRLAWLYVNGEWPTAKVFAINKDPLDLRFSNLRGPIINKPKKEAGPRGRRVRKPWSKSGAVGVYGRQNKWEARIIHEGQFYALGVFDTLEEAASARKAAEDRLWGDK